MHLAHVSILKALNALKARPAPAPRRNGKEIQVSSIKDVFDLWWQWTEKPVDSMLTIPADMHNPVVALAG
jgi:hypothetical protein